MKHFTVEEGFIESNIITAPVASDGNWCGELDENMDREYAPLWYRVEEFGEAGNKLNTVYYNVSITNGRNNANEVLEQIKQDHPASEWQNNEW